MYNIYIKDAKKLFFTSDTHIGHFHIAEYCKRPFESRAEMNQALIDNWNKVVPEDGIVIHCGDLTLLHKEDLKAYKKLFSKLNGRILLCRGNHDRIPLIIEEDDKLIASVDIALINVHGVKIIASHYPLLAYPADYNVFGHIHTLSDGKCYGSDEDVNDRLRPTQYDVGVDQNNYAPLPYEELMKIFTKQKEVKTQQCDLSIYATLNNDKPNDIEYQTDVKVFSWKIRRGQSETFCGCKYFKTHAEAWEDLTEFMKTFEWQSLKN